MARALGSYPNGRWFKSDFRYQRENSFYCFLFDPKVYKIFYGSLVKWLRHGPFTAVTRVRLPYESPSRDNKKDIVPENPDKIGVFAVLYGDF